MLIIAWVAVLYVRNSHVDGWLEQQSNNPVAVFGSVVNAELFLWVVIIIFSLLINEAQGGDYRAICLQIPIDNDCDCGELTGFWSCSGGILWGGSCELEISSFDTDAVLLQKWFI